MRWLPGNRERLDFEVSVIQADIGAIMAVAGKPGLRSKVAVKSRHTATLSPGKLSDICEIIISPMGKK